MKAYNPPAGLNAADRAKVIAAYTESYNLAYAESVQAGRKAERDRVRGILTHPEAKERQQLARSIACETELDVTQAIQLLAAVPKHASGSTLATLMAGIKNPTVGMDFDDVVGQVGIDAAAVYEFRRNSIAH
jgi:hypothetical protein